MRPHSQTSLEVPGALRARGLETIRKQTTGLAHNADTLIDDELPTNDDPNKFDPWPSLDDLQEHIEVLRALVADDIEEALYATKASLGFYIGGMGAKGQNYHTKLMARMGFEEEAYKIQDLFFAGKREEAIAAVPDDFADEISLVGPASRIKERLEHWRNSPITELLISARSPEALRQAAELVNG